MIRWLVNHLASVLLVVFCIVLFGIGTYVSLPRESNPDIKVPVVLVTTPYIGVSPEDVESLVTIPLETELTGLKDLKVMKSTSAEGASIVFLEFEPEAVIEDALQQVRDRVSRAKSQLPPDAEEPAVREISFSDMPIVIITIAGPADEETLKQLGETLEDDLGSIKGVLEAKLSGGRERQYRVKLDPTRMDHYGLSTNDVLAALSAENINIPGGEVGVGNTNVLLRVPGELTSAQDIERVAIKRVGDRPVFIGDVGSASFDYADRDSYSRMNGVPAISIAVSKRTGANILEVADEIKRRCREHAKHWPKGVRFRVLGDQSRNIANMVSELENNVISALILVVLVLLFFMGWRNSLFVAIAIPLSMMLGMIAIWASGMTLNMVVLFSLILALGMLVDNAIVLVENIYRHVEEGAPPMQAAIEGTKEVAGAVGASTLTTVAAFFPLVFWTGIMGQFMGFLPRTVIIVLVSSLLVAIGILPVLASRLLPSKPRPASGADDDGSVPPPHSDPATMTASEVGRVMWAYRTLLDWSIRFRYVSAALVTATLVGTFVAYGALNHGTEFFPETEPDQATIAVRAPDGTDLEATDLIVRRIEAVLAAEENVDVYVAETGVAGGGNQLAGAQAAKNEARLTVDFLPHATKATGDDKVRVEPTTVTIDRIRKAVRNIAGARIVVDKQRMGPPVGAPIAVEVSGDNFHRVGRYAARVRRELGEIEGTTDLQDDYRVGRPELRLRIDRGAAKRVGASTRVVAGTIRTAVAGTKATAIRDGEDEYDVMVELAPRFKNDLQAILALRIPGRVDTSPNTFSVPLSTVASGRLAGGSGSIRHEDRKLVVTITGDVLQGHNENEVRASVVDYIEKAEAQPGMRLRLGGAQDEQQESMNFLINAFLIAIFLIAVVLVTQFNSFTTPLIILGTVVLSLVGVLWGLVLTGTPFGVVMTGLGVISLAGVVVNNAIVLLDYVEQLKRQGVGVREALIHAGMVRFRPVMLTAATTILGLVPMATGIAIDFRSGKVMLGSQSADWWGPMAIAVIFGLAFATLLTLVMVPTFYSIVDDVRGGAARLLGRARMGATTVDSNAE
ncbi:MAG TPA: efflux RND transporter permease subunit [Sorangium sp.]|nr:efflux RND transporter permease subunit [Sorangium sp.]